MASDRYSGMSAVLDAVRRAPGIRQADLIEQVALGRSVVAERVAELEKVGLLVTTDRAPSTGGRAPRLLRLTPGLGYVIGVDVAAGALMVGAGNLAGELIGTTHREQIDVAVGPSHIIARIEVLAAEVRAELRAWGPPLAVGVGLPGPVNVDEGVAVDVPVMPGWNNYPVQADVAARLSTPVWVDGRVNLLALAELVASPRAAKAQNLLYFGAGAGSDAALLINGALYRGAHGLAGAIGHIAVPDAGMVVCLCGRVGCLEAVSSGWAIARDGMLLAQSGRSAMLAGILAERGEIRAYDITMAADAGDVAARELLTRTSMLLGKSLVSLVSLFAPQMLLIGGGIARAGRFALDPIRTVLRDQLPAAVARDLVIDLSVLGEVGGVLGATQLAVGRLFEKDQLPALMNRIAAMPEVENPSD